MANRISATRETALGKMAEFIVDLSISKVHDRERCGGPQTRDVDDCNVCCSSPVQRSIVPRVREFPIPNVGTQLVADRCAVQRYHRYTLGKV